LRDAGTLARNPVVRGVAKAAPFIGAGIGIAGDLATGNSVRRTAAHAVGSVAGGTAGTSLGGAVCGFETAATFGFGSLACPFIVGGFGAGGAWVGIKSSDEVASLFGW